MVTVKLTGGLGNQMFQYALGRSVAAKNRDQLILDTSHYDEFPHLGRRYELGCFNLYDHIDLSGRPKSYYNFKADKSIYFNLKQLVKKTTGSPKIVMEHGFSAELNRLIGTVDHSVGRFDPSVLENKGNLYLVGFWNNQKYFLDYSDTTRKDFNFKHKATGANLKLLKAIVNQESVSLHVRRGDYVAVPAVAQTLGSPSPNYYKKAVEFMQKTLDKPFFYVFSDDPSWCRKNLNLGHNHTIVENNSTDKGSEDLRLMSSCKHNIIANSTFSWWGAWLNNKPDKVVVAPKVWFRDTSINTDDVVPEGWIRL